MYKLIIIDDEPRVREQLSKFIEWETLEIEMVRTFSNGRDALSFIEKNEVDIVISDIKMPVMDGLELAAVCHELKPQIQFVIISAYRDFEFAKSAMQQHVADYVLKPIKHDELYNTLKNIVKTLKINALEAKIGRSAFVSPARHNAIRNLFLRLMTQNIESAQTLDEELLAAQLPVTLAKQPCIFYQMRLYNYDIFMERSWKHEKHMLYTAIDNLIPFELDSAYIIGVRYLYDTIDLLAVSGGAALDFSETADIIMQKISASIKTNLGLDNQIKRIRFLPSLDKLVHSEQQNISVNDDPTVSKIMDYVSEHISEPLTLSEIAQVMHFNAAYLGTLFKKKTGLSFIDYLNRTKIDRSIEYLHNPKISISEISELLGYKSEAYYYELFKKYYNMTPSQYRNTIIQK